METSHRPLVLLRCKVAVVGDACVGKSALIQLFHKNNYPKQYLMTSWTDFCVKQVNIKDSNNAVELYLFDCGGQSVFSVTEANSSIFENTAFVMCVYDVANKESFDSVRKWLSKVRSRRSPNTPPLPGIIVGNKIDLRRGDEIMSRAVVSTEQGEALAKAEGMAFCETSAAEQVDHDKPFQFIAEEFHKKYQDTVRRAELLAQGPL